MVIFGGNQEFSDISMMFFLSFVSLKTLITKIFLNNLLGCLITLFGDQEQGPSSMILLHKSAELTVLHISCIELYCNY